MQKKVTILILYTILFLFHLNISVQAEQLVIITGEYEPYVSEKMENLGLTTEIITQTLKVMDIEARYIFATWVRCEEEIKTGNVFATFPYAVNDQRKQFAEFSDTIVTSRNVWFYYSPNLHDFKFIDLQGLKPYRIGGVVGYYYEPIFAEAGLKVHYVRDIALLFKMLSKKRLDIFTEDELVGMQIIHRLYPQSIDLFKVAKKPFKENTLHLMVSKYYPDYKILLAKFNQGLLKLKKNGVYASILARYGQHQ